MIGLPTVRQLPVFFTIHFVEQFNSWLNDPWMRGHSHTLRWNWQRNYRNACRLALYILSHSSVDKQFDRCVWERLISSFVARTCQLLQVVQNKVSRNSPDMLWWVPWVNENIFYCINVYRLTFVRFINRYN